jgi:hypothetical protein
MKTHKAGDLVRRVLVTALVWAALGAGATSFVAAPASAVRRSLSHSASQLSQFPGIVLWAWERPEDLRFIDPRQVGVAFLAETLYLRGEEVIVRPRLQPLQVPPGTALMATARIETDHVAFRPASLDSSPILRSRAATAIAGLARLPGVQAIQIDFDASVSERVFYRDLLNDVRRGLPDSTALSITALASWCSGDNWLAGLPVDEAVPMLFRMGADRREILDDLREGRDFEAPICRASIGISTDEPLPTIRSCKRVYVFRPSPWTKPAVLRVSEEVRQ